MIYRVLLYSGTIYKVYKNLYNAIKFFWQGWKISMKQGSVKLIPIQTKTFSIDLNTNGNFYENHEAKTNLIFSSCIKNSYMLNLRYSAGSSCGR